MTRKMTPVEESFAAWRKDPAYLKAYNALEDEFSLARAMIEARAHAGLTQEPDRMHTTSGDHASRKRSGEAVNADARAPRRSYGDAAEDFVRAGTGRIGWPMSWSRASRRPACML